MKTIVILLENFYPAYKGGGPIQSITNLILLLENEYNVYVITSAYDLGSKNIMPGIKPNTWENILLPQTKQNIKVWYAAKSKPGYRFFKRLMLEKIPDFVYINGIFSYSLFLIPLTVIKNLNNKPKIIICPRGMLQKGALANKWFKKKSYLNILKFSGLVNKAVWHATNAEEEEDILKYFVVNNGVVIAMNIPKEPVGQVSFVKKVSGNLKLIYLSLITEKKNLLFLLRLIKATENISLDIYGPVKDNAYWNECHKLINEMAYKAKYLGDVLPLEVQNTFSKYAVSALLSKGENFGHALYESLSVGRPIITSNFTPWNNLVQLKAGWNLDISNFSKCIEELNRIKELDQSEFSKFCTGAYELAKDYFIKSNNLDNYKKLFSVL